MPNHDSQTAREEPGTGSPDSNAGKGVLPGGITPEVQTVLETLDPQARSVLEKDIRQRNQFFTSERQRLARDVRVAGVFNELRQDPLFQRFVEAQEKGTHSNFVRDEATRLGLTQNNGQGGNQAEFGGAVPLEATGGEAGTPGQTPAHTSNLEREFQEFKERFERREQAEVQMRQEQETEAFRNSHPDWEDYFPAMQEVARTYPKLSLDDTLALAKSRVEQGLANFAPADEQQQQATDSPDAAQAADSGVNQGGDVSPQESPAPPTSKVHTLADAYKLAKETTGVSFAQKTESLL